MRRAAIKYRGLGSTGLRVSIIGVGTWQLGGEWGQRFTQQEVGQLLGRARELGVNLIDTAECYGDHLAEALIGTAIHQHRDAWLVATEFGHQFHPEALQQAGRSPVQLRTDHWAPAEVIAQLEGSLRALRTDYVDLYQMHSGTPEVFGRHDLWDALNQQVAAGKVRHLGVSLGGGDVDQARHATEVGASVIQVGYNRLDQTAEQGVLPACLDQDLGVIIREPLANGYLSGKYRPGPGSPPATTGARATTRQRPRPSWSWSPRSVAPSCRQGWRWRPGRSPGACNTRPSAAWLPAPSRSSN